jgi:hypothetical protein
MYTSYIRGVPKLSFKDAAEKLYLMGVRKRQHFKNLSREKNRPKDIPSSPHTFYKEFTSWEDMIAIGKAGVEQGKAKINQQPSYNQLKSLNRRYSIITKAKYNKAVLTDKIGENLPVNPELFYGSEFEGWEEFLAPKNHPIDFETARAFCRGYELSTQTDWDILCSEGHLADFIPKSPNDFYPEFTTWEDFLITPDPI